MNQLFSTLIFVFGFSVGIDAQSFSTQVLNKLGIYANNAQTQDYDNDGDLDIIITNVGADVGIPGELPVGLYWLENETTKQFPVHLIVDQNIVRPKDVDIVDIDGDNLLDYVVCMGSSVVGGDGELVWFQRQPNNAYIKWTISAGKDFDKADVADFDHDGKPDIAAVGFDQDEGYLFVNNGFFFTESTIVTGNIQPETVDANDIDQDGDIDIVFGGGGLTNQNEGARVMYNNGSASFSLGFYLVTYTSVHAYIETDVKIIDVNNDGKNDIVGWGLLGELYIFNGANGFQKFTIYDPNLGGGFILFDIDGNGLLDIVVQDWGADLLIVLYQNASFQFTPRTIERNWDNQGASQMAFGDLDGDGDNDLIFPENGNIDGDVSWYENINGNLYRHQLYAQLKGARIPKFADVDNDGDKDILLTVSSDLGEEEDELMLFENTGNNNFINWRLSDNLDYAADVEPADIDGDGDLDAFATATNANDLIWLRNDGTKANWVTTVIDANANQALGIRAVDLDADSSIDVVLCSNNDDKVFWYRNNGMGNFTKAVIDANVDAPREIEAADLDGDGDIDLALACSNTTNGVVIYINDAAQGFTKQVAFTGKLVRDIEIADWNSDGKPDLVFTLLATSPVNPQQEVIALINNGANVFTTTPLVINAEKGDGLKVADLDNDGDLDFVVGRNQQVRVRMWLQTPSGLVGSTISDVGVTGPQVLGLDVADTDGDGKNEIVFADFVRDDLVLVSINCFSGAILSATATHATCGQSNGTASVATSGGTDLSYHWSNNATTAAIENLATGTYTVTVTANGGCTSTATVTITAQQVATLTTVKTNAICGNPNGAATVNAQNGVGLAGFLWSNGATTQTATDLAAGVYTVTVTDINGCTVTTSVTITAVAVATLTSVPANTTCGNNDGKVTVTVSGGASISSYLWSNGATTKNLTNLPGGIYTVTATDANGCQIIGQATVIGLPNPVVNLGADIALPQGQSAVLDATGTDLTYLWSTGATTATITINAMGTYTVTVTNNFGCTATDAIVVSIISATTGLDPKYNIFISPNPTEGLINIKCEGGITTSVQVFNHLGQLMIEDSAIVPEGTLRALNIANYPNGFYQVKVSGNGFSRTVKVVKN